NQGAGMLNAANANKPGGGFEGNGTVQEEMLCAVTTLYPNLKEVTYPIQDSILSTKNVKPIVDLNLYASYKDQAARQDFYTNYVAKMSQQHNVFLPEKQINLHPGFTVFSVAAHNRASSQQFDQATFFFDMLEKWRLVFAEAATQKLNRLIAVIPGSGVFANFPNSNQADPEYVKANAAAFSLAYQAFSPDHLKVVLPRVGQDLENNIDYFLGLQQSSSNYSKNSSKRRLDQFITALPASNSASTSGQARGRNQAPQLGNSQQQRHWPKATKQDILAHKSGFDRYIQDWSAVTFQQTEGPAQKSGRSPFWVSKVDRNTGSFDVSIRDVRTGLCTRYRVTYNKGKNSNLYNFIKNK
ncbi:MAG: poly(ADP-ribose) glycohydrolase domain-containing protein, partial [Alphaproteobacteria bacterium]